MNHPITLASGKVGGELIVISLIESPGTPGSVTIHWPKQAMSVSARRFPDVAAVVARATQGTHAGRQYASDAEMWA
jgi:hypothetical protein